MAILAESRGRAAQRPEGSGVLQHLSELQRGATVILLVPAPEDIGAGLQIAAFPGIVAKSLQSLADTARLGHRHVEIPVQEGDEYGQRLGFTQAVLLRQVFNGTEVECHDPALLHRVAADILGIDTDDGVLRTSFVHYTSPDEIDRLIEALDTLL